MCVLARAASLVGSAAALPESLLLCMGVCGPSEEVLMGCFERGAQSLRVLLRACPCSGPVFLHPRYPLLRGVV